MKTIKVYIFLAYVQIKSYTILKKLNKKLERDFFFTTFATQFQSSKCWMT